MYHCVTKIVNLKLYHCVSLLVFSLCLSPRRATPFLTGYSGLKKRRGGGVLFQCDLSFRHPSHMATRKKQLGTFGGIEELFGDST